VGTDDATEARRKSFDANAQLYGQMRPSYPRELVDDAIELAAIPPGGRVLEIGCGAGQATAAFATRGLKMLSLDVGADLVAEARSRVGDTADVAFHVGSFEEWDQAQRSFHAVLAASCFHWMTPGVRYVKTAGVLEPRGALVLLSHAHVRKKEGFFAEVQDVYREHAPEMHKRSRGGNGWEVPGEEGIELFDAPVERRYPWSAEHDAQSYVRLLHTYSGHACLPDDRRERLYAAIADLIERRYDGRVVKHHESVLHVRRKKGPATDV